MKTLEVGKAYYNGVLDQNKNRQFLDPDIEADKYYLVFESGNPIGGFATNASGYLTGFFSNSKGKGRDIFSLMLQQAMRDAEEGVELFDIFCIGDFLRDFYEEFGFKVMDTIEWDDEFAPVGWNYEKFGRPNLYNMRSTKGNIRIKGKQK